MFNASEFINETVTRHQENEQLRQFVNKALAVLTSQLQQNFDSLDQKLQKCENQSSQDSLEQKLNDLEHKYMELERKYTQLQQVSNEFNMMKSQLVSLENKTNQINNDVLILKQHGNIKPLQEIQALQQAIQTVSAQTHSLSINERALSQDFLALHNMTIDLKLALNEITTNTSNHLNEFETKTSSLLFYLEHRQNTTAAGIRNQLKEVETKTNTQLLRI
ncbi:Hypothetical predicted protein [Mytilus galloprovincialis]|uniref:Uncharacterized protein n=1 Tax=Mytilus galloprovincialis TaxID=29158 RepID=A0A8B6C0W3_MYTGA|nr:Hypothetical predicted protein [Mytilus galloprovincialis]